jgi:hypothetical protein
VGEALRAEEVVDGEAAGALDAGAAAEEGGLDGDRAGRQGEGAAVDGGAWRLAMLPPRTIVSGL